jgi:hypothetical protein
VAKNHFNTEEGDMRYLGLITISAAILSFGLTLGAAPQPAEAGKACNRAGLPSPCIKKSDIRNNQVRTEHVKTNNLSGIDMLDEAGAEFDLPPSPNFQQIVVGTADVIVASVTLSVPAGGTVVVNGTGFSGFTGSTTSLRCALTSANVLGNNNTIMFLTVNGNASFRSVAQTWAFNRPAGSFTINWVCDTQGGTVNFFNPTLTAVYVTTKY